MVPPFPTSPLTPTPTMPLADRAAARRQQGPLHEAYARYVRLYWLLCDLPTGHPACQPLAVAVCAADAHWRALCRAARDTRLLAVGAQENLGDAVASALTVSALHWRDRALAAEAAVALLRPRPRAPR